MEEQTQVVQEFFYDVYQNYNVQFWGMLGNGSFDILVDSIENATRKLALDIVHRYVIIRVQAENENFSRGTFRNRFDPRIDLAPFFLPPDIVLSYHQGLLCGPSGRL